MNLKDFEWFNKYMQGEYRETYKSLDNPNLEVVKINNAYFLVAKHKIEIADELTVNYQDFDFEGKRSFK